MRYFLSFALLACLMASCNDNYTPKPKGYFKIDYPQKTYVAFNQPDYPYAFEYPAYGKVIKDSTFFDTIAENPYWINVDFPEIGRAHV